MTNLFFGVGFAALLGACTLIGAQTRCYTLFAALIGAIREWAEEKSESLGSFMEIRSEVYLIKLDQKLPHRAKIILLPARLVRSFLIVFLKLRFVNKITENLKDAIARGLLLPAVAPFIVPLLIILIAELALLVISTLVIWWFGNIPLYVVAFLMLTALTLGRWLGSYYLVESVIRKKKKKVTVV